MSRTSNESPAPMELQERTSESESMNFSKTISDLSDNEALILFRELLSDPRLKTKLKRCLLLTKRTIQSSPSR